MSIDYSERAITMRIRQVSQLRRLCLSLGRAGRTARDANAQAQKAVKPSTGTAAKDR
jgi:hypothetical protein